MDKLPLGVDINNLIDDLRKFSWEAADILIHYSKMLKNSTFRENIIDSTDINDPVTIADLKVNQIIINRINEKYKDISWEILSEENVKDINNEFNTNTKWLWVLDPLDGTKDFIEGTGNYAMHLALNCNGKPHIGIVLIPSRDELWIANGQNVWCERRNGSKIDFQTIKKTNKRELKEMILVSSKNHRNPILKKLIRKIKFKSVTLMGSIGCKVASLLRGESDIYITLSLPGKSAPKDWDFAAPEAILNAAGGALTYINNQELSYNQKGFEQRGIIIASSDKKNCQETQWEKYRKMC